MAIKRTKERQPTPVKIFLYGGVGSWKTTTASRIQGVGIVDVEDSAIHYNVDRIGGIETMSDISDAAKEYLADESISTIVFDGAGQMQNIATRELIKNYNQENPDEKVKKSLGDFGYGKGYELLQMYWIKYIGLFNYIAKQGKNVILIGHELIQRYESPVTDPYDRFVPDIHKKAVNALLGDMDAVLFVKREHVAKKRDGGFTEKFTGVSTGRVLCHTQENAAWIAKSRFQLPATITFGPDVWKFFNLKVNEDKTSK